MQCIKTGFYAYLVSHEAFVYGDAFRLPDIHAADARFDKEEHTRRCGSNGWLLLRICQVDGYKPLQSRINLLVRRVDHWFDERAGDNTGNSTLLAPPGHWQWLGYDGKPLQQVNELPVCFKQMPADNKES